MFSSGADTEKIYREVKELGEGVFGKVTLVKDEAEDRFLARKSISDIIDILIGIRESDVLSRIGSQCPSVAGLRDFRLYMEDERYHAELYLDYCSGGSLETILTNESKNPDKPPLALIGGIGRRIENLGLVIHTLDHLQKMGIYHMDIKTENFLLHRGRLVLCDFSNYLRDTPWKTGLPPPISAQEATFYRAPEVAHGRVSRATIPVADVWAIGVMTLELMGNWETVEKLDFRVNEKMQRVSNLMQRIKTCQTSFQKRVKRDVKRTKFETPSRLLFRTIFPKDFPETFGSDFENPRSPENEMVWCLMFAREIRNLDFEQLLQESLEYFRLRSSPATEEEIEGMQILFRDILPAMLKIRPGERADMQTVSQLFEERLGVKNPHTFVPESPTPQLGLWERIPDPLWKTTVEKFRDSTGGVKIQYGQNAIDYPIHHLVYTKHLAEKVLEKLIMGVSDQYPLPKNPDERTVFYEMILSACVFLASEVLDFIFPYQKCSWFDDRGLETVSPYLEISCKLLLGEIAFTTPSKEELEVLKGERNL